MEEGPSWTGRTIDPIFYAEKPLTLLFRENQSLVSFLSESGGGALLDRGNHRPISYVGKPLTYSLFRENQSLVSFLSESGGGSGAGGRAQLDRENH
jgi:hypothetical protein